MNPVFIFDGRFYLAANKDAAALGAVMSKMRLTEGDIREIRHRGYIPRLTNGQEIGRTDVKV